jgi:biopolymer transport protein TolR
MAVAPIGAGGGRRRHRRGHRKPMSDINVTPFVDVMLVLLIVFMVTAPLLSAGVPVDLPQAQAKPLALEKEPISVTVDTQGRVFIKDSEVTMDNLVATLSSAVQGNLDERIYVRGDKAVSYGQIMQVMGVISSAGFTHIGLVALKEPDS